MPVLGAGAGCARGGQGAAGLLVLVVCVVLVPGAGAGCARSGDTSRCIACKNWSCCQCRVQPRKIFCIGMLLLSGVYAGVICYCMLFAFPSAESTHGVRPGETSRVLTLGQWQAGDTFQKLLSTSLSNELATSNKQV